MISFHLWYSPYHMCKLIRSPSVMPFTRALETTFTLRQYFSEFKSIIETLNLRSIRFHTKLNRIRFRLLFGLMFRMTARDDCSTSQSPSNLETDQSFHWITFVNFPSERWDGVPFDAILLVWWTNKGVFKGESHLKCFYFSLDDDLCFAIYGRQRSSFTDNISTRCMQARHSKGRQKLLFVWIKRQRKEMNKRKC